MDENNQVNNLESESSNNVQDGVSQPVVQEPMKQKFYRNKKFIISILSAVLVLVVIFAVYRFVYLPNTPQSVLKKSTSNLLKKEKISGDGNIEFVGSDPKSKLTAKYNIQTDSTKKSSQVKAQVDFFGIKTTAELRNIDTSSYLKIDDLSAVSTLAKATFGEEAAPYVDPLVKQISGKWIEFDSTTAKSIGADKCTKSLSTRISDSDIKQIMNIYDKNTFININKISNDNIGSVKVKKAELSLNEQKAKDFSQEMSKIDLLKKLEQCAESTDSDKSNDNKPKTKPTYQFTAWVDHKKKEIIKLEIKSTQDKDTMNFDITFNGDYKNIEKPEGAVPVSQLFTQLAPVLGSSSVNTPTSNFGL